jgi:hypothetical protein
LDKSSEEPIFGKILEKSNRKKMEPTSAPNKCTHCGTETTEISAEGLCPECQHSATFARLNVSAQEAVDQHIFNNDILTGMRKFKEELSISLPAAMDLYQWRFNFLSEYYPTHFKGDLETYWEGFYS